MAREHVQDLFRQVAQQRPRQVAIDRVVRQITYGELERRANQIAATLTELGVPRATPVAILAADPIEIVGAILGILRCGGIFVPLDPTFPRPRLEEMVACVGPRWGLVEGRFCDLANGLGNATTRWVEVDGDRVASADGEARPLEIDGDAPCSIYFTSGSTGRPKAILGRLKGIAHFARWEGELLGVESGTRVSQLASPSFDGFLKDVFVPLLAGGVVAAPETRATLFETPRLIDWIDVEGIEVLHCVPSVLRAILAESPSASYFADLRWIVLAGEVLQPADVRRVHAIYGDRLRLLNLYGPTETTITKLFHRVEPADSERPSIPIGRPMPGAAAMVLGPAGQPCRPGAVGEIYLRTPYRALGYWEDPEQTDEVFRPNPFVDDPSDRIYRTGDFGRLLEDGSFEFLGRRDQQVKIRGVRIELTEIENHLRTHPGVADTAVIDRDDPEGNKILAAYLVLAADTTTGEVRSHLAEQLPDFMVPSVFVALDELPRTLGGKIDRRALPTLEQIRAEQSARTAPRNTVEEILAAIWSQVLKLESVGIDESFFELGGHSLLATQILSRIREILKVELPLRTLLAAPTIAQLASEIEGRIAGGGAGETTAIERVPRDGELPLSFAQQRMWLLDRLDPESTAFLIPFGLRLGGPLETRWLEAAIAAVIRRHEALRSRFPAAGDGLPRQVIEPPDFRGLPRIDLANLSPARRELEALRLAAADLARPFDLASGPLLRVALLRLAADDHALLATLHHIIADGWSRGVLVEEISELYAAQSENRAPRLSQLTIQVADHAAWQRRQHEGEGLAAELAYWRQQLSDLPPPFRLPTDRPRPAQPTHAGGRVPLALAAPLVEALADLARRSGATLFMTLMAAFQALVFRLSSQIDGVIGSTVAGRDRPQLEPLIGCFVNMLALRADGSGNPRFTELLVRSRDVVLDGLAHQAMPFELLVQELDPERDASRSPIFQIVFSLQNAPLEELELAGLEVSVPEVGAMGAKYDLLLDLWPSEDALGGALEYACDLFDSTTAERLVGHYRALLEDIAEHPDKCLGELSLLTESELRETLAAASPAAVAELTGGTFDTLWAAAQSDEDAPAVIYEGAWRSRRQLAAEARRLACLLRLRGAQRGDRIALGFEHGIEEVVALVGVLLAGAAWVPLDLGHPAERWRQILDDAGVSLVLTAGAAGEALRATASASGVATLDLEREASTLAEQSEEVVASDITPGDLAYVIHTSGSTGRPKGVAVSHGALANYVGWANRMYLRGEAMEIPLYSSLTFDLTVTSIFLALSSGNPLRIYRPNGNAPVLEQIVEDDSVGLLKLTPSHLALLRGRDLRHSNIRRLIVGGEALSRELASEILACFGGEVEIYNEYGPTEATVGCMIQRFDPSDTSTTTVPIGRPAANARIYVLDRWHRPVPPGASGAMFLAGEGLATCYLGRAAATAERFVPDPFTVGERMYDSGDLARRRLDHRLEYLGRSDDQVKILGHRIEPGEVETVLGEHPEIARVVVAAVGDDPDHRRLVAWAVAVEDASPGQDMLRRYLAERLPSWMVPTICLVVPSLPTTAHGKVDRRALEASLAAAVEHDTTTSPPTTDVELKIAEIWREILRLPHVGAFDNFFHLGGQSILAAQVIQRINQAFQVRLPLRSMFSELTVAGLALLVEETLIERLETENELERT